VDISMITIATAIVEFRCTFTVRIAIIV